MFRNTVYPGILLLLSVIINSCEKDIKEEPERLKVFLTVQISDGIEGNPKSGKYEYDTGMFVNYGYRALEGYVNLLVTLNGKQVAHDSTFWIYEDVILKAEAEHKTLWRFDTGIPVYYSAPAIGDDGTIYFGSGMYGGQQGTLYAVNPDGTLKWSYPGTSALYSPVIGEDGNIYIQDFYDRMMSVTPNGVFRWSYSNYPTPNIQNVGQRCPAIGADGTVYVASDGLYALNPLNGSLKWVFMQTSSTKASPSIGADGTIYVVFSQDLLVAVNPDGTEKWHNSFTYPWEMSFSPPAIDNNGVIYLGAEARYEGVDLSSVYAFNPDSTLKWKYDVEGIRWVRASPVIDANGNIIVATKANELENPAMVIAISPQGQKVWDYTVENIHVTADDIYCTPAIDNNGLIYFSAETGYFYVLNPDGTLNFSYMLHAGVNWSSPAISSDSVIYMGGMFGSNYEGSFFAVKISSNNYALSPWPKFRHDNHNTGRF
jgi:outer membrane protein assembly factor BamB